MKLLIKADDKGLKIKSNGETKILLPALSVACHNLFAEIANNQEGYEELKDMFITNLKALQYDGSFDNEVINEWVKARGFENENNNGVER